MIAAISGVQVLGAAVLLLAAGTCRADVEARIVHCAASASSAERIACLEESLRELEATAGTTSAPAPALEEPALTPEALRSTVPPSAPAPEQGAPAAGHRARQPAVANLPSALPRANPAEELGAEQVAARQNPDEATPVTARATVVEFRFVGYRRLLTRLDNGQVWRQLDSDRVSVERGLRDGEPFEVEMWETPFGGYRMRILPLDRTLRVERLE